MKLDYIEDINEYGDNIVRLYDFDMSQASKLVQSIKQTVINDKMQLELTDIDFIQPRNCGLSLRISNEDDGITTEDGENFFCDMTIAGYEQMISLIEPFSKKDSNTYQLLYDIDNPTDFLLSPKGTW